MEYDREIIVRSRHCWFRNRFLRIYVRDGKIIKKKWDDEHDVVDFEKNIDISDLNCTFCLLGTGPEDLICDGATKKEVYELLYASPIPPFRLFWNKRGGEEEEQLRNKNQYDYWNLFASFHMVEGIKDEQDDFIWLEHPDSVWLSLESSIMDNNMIKVKYNFDR